MPGRQLIMNFPVTATSHTLADYRARGGYQTLAKALAMTPQDVTKEIVASGLLGHGGAAFPVGRKPVTHISSVPPTPAVPAQWVGVSHVLAYGITIGSPGPISEVVNLAKRSGAAGRSTPCSSAWSL